MQPKQHYIAIDLLRLLSILAVVMIHTTTKEIEAVRLDVSQIPWSLFLNQIGRFAVPVFFMISGFVLELSYSNSFSYFSYIKKRIGKIFVPYLLWSAIYYYFVYTNNNISFLKSLLLGGASYQLYFIPTILIFYLIFPFIHKFEKIILNKWSMISLAILQIYFLYHDYYIHPLTFDYPISIAFLNFYFFILGIFIYKHQLIIFENIKKFKLIIGAGTALSGWFVFNQGYNLYLETHNYYTFYSQWRPSVFIYSILFGSLFYYIFSMKIFNLNFFKKLSSLSFFVFFVHVIVLEFIWQKIGVNIYREQLWFDYAFFLTVAGISFLLAYIAHKIPYLSRLTG